MFTNDFCSYFDLFYFLPPAVCFDALQSQGAPDDEGLLGAEPEAPTGSETL